MSFSVLKCFLFYLLVSFDWSFVSFMVWLGFWGLIWHTFLLGLVFDTLFGCFEWLIHCSVCRAFFSFCFVMVIWTWFFFALGRRDFSTPTFDTSRIPRGRTFMESVCFFL